MQIPLVDLKRQYKSLKKEVNQAFQKTASSASFIKGPALEEFENEFAKFIGVKHCIGVASGTDALEISLRALGIGKGDEVILPANTFVATAYAITYTGAKPVLVDIDPKTYNINVSQIENKINKRTKVIIPVHLYGQPAQMNKVLMIAKNHKLAVVEDACQAHGALFNKKRVGSLGTLAAFSFYPGKNLGAYGDGGAIMTNSKKLAERIIKMREYGGNKYFYDEIGFNSRLDALQASILSIKLKYLDKWNKKRGQAARYYNKLFSNRIPQVTTPSETKEVNPVYHLYVIRAPMRDNLIQYLSTKGISTGVHYPIPLHLQKSLKDLGYKKGDFPVTEKASTEILSLPIFPGITHSQQNYVVNSIKRFLRKNI